MRVRSRISSTLLLLLLSPVWGSADENDLAAQVREDLARFRADLFEKDNSFSADARERGEGLLKKLEARADSLSFAELELGVAEIVALADNGHTLLLNPRWTKDYNRVPVLFLMRGDSLYVGRSEGDPALVGAVVKSLGGHSFGELERVWRRYQGGEPGWRREYLYFFIESPEMLYVAGLIDSPERVEMVVETPGGEERTVVLEATRELPPLKGIEAYLPPAREIWLTRESGDDAKRPLYLQQPDARFRYVALDGGVAYVRMRAISGSESEKIEDFIAATQKKLKQTKPSKVVLDLRHNTGGDLNNARDFMRFLAKIVGEEGRVVALTSGRTFSAAISSLGYLKQAGGERVTIVGEPVGDRLEFWAEGGLVELPNTGAAFIHATERHNYQTGCQEDDCHGSIKRHPIRVESLQPDVLVVPTWEDFAAGRDPLLEAALELLAG